MEIRNPLSSQLPTAMPRRQDVRADNAGAAPAYEPQTSPAEESPRRERVGQVPIEGQLLDKRLAFDMLQAARRNGLAGEKAYGEERARDYQTRRALDAYEGQQQAAQFEEGSELLPRLNAYV